MKKKFSHIIKIFLVEYLYQKRKNFIKDCAIFFKIFQNGIFLEKKFKKIFFLMGKKSLKLKKFLLPLNLSLFLKSFDFKIQKSNQNLNFYWKFMKFSFSRLETQNLFLLENLIFRKTLLQKKNFWNSNEKIFIKIFKKFSKTKNSRHLCFLFSNFKFLYFSKEFNISSRKKNFLKVIFSFDNFMSKEKDNFSINLFLKKKILEIEGDLSFFIFIKSSWKIKKKKISKKKIDWLFFFSQRCLKKSFKFKNFSRSFTTKSFFFECNSKTFFPPFFHINFWFLNFLFFVSNRTKKRFFKIFFCSSSFWNFLDKNFVIKNFRNPIYPQEKIFLLKNFFLINNFFPFLSLEQNNEKKILYFFLGFLLKPDSKITPILKNFIFYQLENVEIKKKEKKFKLTLDNYINPKTMKSSSDNFLNYFLLGGLKNRKNFSGQFFESFLKKNFKFFNGKDQNPFFHNFLSVLNWSYIVFYNIKNIFQNGISISTYKLELKNNYVGIRNCEIIKKIHLKIKKKETPFKNQISFRYFSPKINKKLNAYLYDSKEIFSTIESVQSVLISGFKKNMQKIFFLSFFKKIWNKSKKKKSFFFLKNIFFEKTLKEIQKFFLKEKFKKKTIVRLLGSCFFCLRKFLKKLTNKIIKKTKVKFKELTIIFKKKIFSKQIQKKIFIDVINIYFGFFFNNKSTILGGNFSIPENFYRFYQQKNIFESIGFLKNIQSTHKKNNFIKVLVNCFSLKIFNNCFDHKKQKKMATYQKNFKKTVLEICIPFDPFIEIISHKFKKIFSKMKIKKNLEILQKPFKIKKIFNFSFFFFRKNFYSSLIEKISLGRILGINLKFQKKKPLNIFFLFKILEKTKNIKKNNLLMTLKLNNFLYSQLKSFPFLKLNFKTCFLKKSYAICKFFKKMIFSPQQKSSLLFYKKNPLVEIENKFLRKFFLIFLKNKPKINDGPFFFLRKKTKKFFCSFYWFSNKRLKRFQDKKKNVLNTIFLTDVLKKNSKGDLNFLVFLKFFKNFKKPNFQISNFLINIFKNQLENKKKNFLSRNEILYEKISKTFIRFLKKLLIFTSKNFIFSVKLITKFLGHKIKKKFFPFKNLSFETKNIKKKTIFLFLISKILDSGLLFGKFFKILSIKNFQLFIGTKINELKIQKKKKILQSIFLFYSFSFFKFIKFTIHFLNIFSKKKKKTREKIFWLFIISISRKKFFFEKKGIFSKKLADKFLVLKNKLIFKPLLIYLKNFEPKTHMNKNIFSFQKIFFFLIDLIFLKENFTIFKKFLAVFFVRLFSFQKNNKNIVWKVYFNFIRKFTKFHFLFFQKKYLKIDFLKFENLIFVDCWIKGLNFNVKLQYFEKKKIYKKIKLKFQSILKILENIASQKVFRLFVNFFTIVQTSGDWVFFYENFLLLFKGKPLFFSKILKTEIFKKKNPKTLGRFLSKFNKVYHEILKSIFFNLIKTDQIFKNKFDTRVTFFRKLFRSFFLFFQKKKKSIFNLFERILFFGPSKIASHILKTSTFYLKIQKNKLFRIFFFYIISSISEIFFYIKHWHQKSHHFFLKKIKTIFFYFKKINNCIFFQSKISKPLNFLFQALFKIPGSNLKLQILQITKIFLKNTIRPSILFNFIYYLFFLFSKIQNSFYLFKIDEVIGIYFFSLKCKKIKFRIISVFFLRLLKTTNLIKKERFYGIFLKLTSFFPLFFQNFYFNDLFFELFAKFLKKTPTIQTNLEGFLCELLMFSFSLKNYNFLKNSLKKQGENSKTIFLKKIKFCFFHFSFFFTRKLDRIKLNIFLTLIKDFYRKIDEFGKFFYILVNFLIKEWNWTFLSSSGILKKFFSKKISLYSFFSKKIFFNFLSKLFKKIKFGNLNFLNEYLIPEKVTQKLIKILQGQKKLFFLQKKNEIVFSLLTCNTLYFSFNFLKKEKERKQYHKALKQIKKKKKKFFQNGCFFSMFFYLIKSILENHFFIHANFSPFFKENFFPTQLKLGRRKILTKFPYFKLKKIFVEILKN